MEGKTGSVLLRKAEFDRWFVTVVWNETKVEFSWVFETGNVPLLKAYDRNDGRAEFDKLLEAGWQIDPAFDATGLRG